MFKLPTWRTDEMMTSHGLVYLLIACVFLIAASTQLLRLLGGRSAKLPHGPRPLPFLGNIMDFGKIAKSPEVESERLAQIYGDVYTLSIGSGYVLVVNSPRIASDLMERVPEAVLFVKKT